MMKCPSCEARGEVRSTRSTEQGVTRRYGCLKCGERWTTQERRTARTRNGARAELPEIAELRLRLDYVQTRLISLLEDIQ